MAFDAHLARIKRLVERVPAEQTEPNWTTGCCGEVDCFIYCLTRFTEQWNALHQTRNGPTAVLLLHKEFRRSGKKYGSGPNWITHAMRHLDHKDLKVVPREKLWLVVQGYGVSSEEERSARKTAAQTGAAMVAVARTRIDQSYEPRVVRVRGGDSAIKPSRIP
jgi:hypothetical protein